MLLGVGRCNWMQQQKKSIAILLLPKAVHWERGNLHPKGNWPGNWRLSRAIVTLGRHFRPFPMDVFIRRVMNVQELLNSCYWGLRRSKRSLALKITLKILGCALPSAGLCRDLPVPFGILSWGMFCGSQSTLSLWMRSVWLWPMALKMLIHQTMWLGSRLTCPSIW